MKWSKVRSLVEASFADSVRGRVTVHSTKYRRTLWSSHARGWIAIDKEHVADFSDSMVWSLLGKHSGDLLPDADRADPYLRKLHEGAFFGREFSQGCWIYAHSSVSGSLVSPSPIIRALALLNAKVGRTRLARLAEAEEHPLPKTLAEFRIEAERALRAEPSAQPR